jgi:hypothetical protein
LHEVFSVGRAASERTRHPQEHLDLRQHVGGEGVMARLALDRLAHGPRNRLPDRRIPEDRAAQPERTLGLQRC